MCVDLMPGYADRSAVDDGGGCGFPVEGADSVPALSRFCNAPRQPGSSYCPKHHARCHLAPGSSAEQDQLREIEALAGAVGGKQGRPATRPPLSLLRRLSRIERVFSRPHCS